MSERRASTLPLYVGGFLGPFGGGVIAVLIPQLRDAFDASTGAVAAAVPAYLVPFAVLSLASGTIGERLGRARVVRAGYVAYAVASLAAALSPGIGVFLALRAAQGAANAFLSPLLLAGLADVTPPERLGRSVGTFAAVQTAAVAVSPLCGGLLGAADWRLAFLAPAGVAVALACRRRRPGARRSSVRPAFGPCSPGGSGCCRQRRSPRTRASPGSHSWWPCARRTTSGLPPSSAACFSRASGWRAWSSAERRAARPTASGG